jgi:hypothetical protein
MNKRTAINHAAVSIFSIFIISILCIAGYRDSDARPTQRHSQVIKTYMFAVDSPTYVFMDSVWRASIRNTGYTMSAPDADQLRATQAGIVNFFQTQRVQQDSAAKKTKK